MIHARRIAGTLLQCLVIPCVLHGQTTTERSAGQAFRNVQVLKDLPASQLLPVMHLMRASLGVRCDYCHAVDGNRLDQLDAAIDGPVKNQARKMIQMVLDLNKAQFDGRAEVTCNTCHRGHPRPVPVPEITQGQFTNTTRGSGAPPRPPLVSATEILDRYLEACGGRASLERVTSRVSRGILLRMKAVNAGTEHAIPVNRGLEEPLEIYQEAPNKFAIVTGPEGSQVARRFNGSEGKILTASGQRPLTEQETSQMVARSHLRRELMLRDRADRLRVMGTELISGREAYVLRSAPEKGRTELLFFDCINGLLLREIMFTPTPIGDDPEQIDYEDYRDVGGVWLPFVIKTSSLDDMHLGTTRLFFEIRNNVEINRDTFQ